MQVNLIDLAKPKFELNKPLYRRAMKSSGTSVYSASIFVPLRSAITVERELKYSNHTGQPPSEEARVVIMYFDHHDKTGAGTREDDLFLTPNEAFGITAK
jgi:hypothetical protein